MSVHVHAITLRGWISNPSYSLQWMTSTGLAFEIAPWEHDHNQKLLPCIITINIMVLPLFAAPPLMGTLDFVKFTIHHYIVCFFANWLLYGWFHLLQNHHLLFLFLTSVCFQEGDGLVSYVEDINIITYFAVIVCTWTQPCSGKNRNYTLENKGRWKMTDVPMIHDGIINCS